MESTGILYGSTRVAMLAVARAVVNGTFVPHSTKLARARRHLACG